MPNVFTPEDSNRLLRWLREGAQLAKAKKGSAARHVDAIWMLIEDAVLVIDRVPDQEKRWLTSGFRSGGWSQIGMTAMEASLIERARSMAAMKPGDTLRVPQANLNSNAEDRAMDCLDFLRWCGVYVKSRKPDAMRRAAVVLARGADHDAFTKVWMADRKDISRSAISKFRHVLVGHVLAGLREECGIIPSKTGCEFVSR